MGQVSHKPRGRQDFHTAADLLSAPLPSIVGSALPSPQLERELTVVGCDLALICDTNMKFKEKIQKEEKGCERFSESRRILRQA